MISEQTKDIMHAMNIHSCNILELDHKLALRIADLGAGDVEILSALITSHMQAIARAVYSSDPEMTYEEFEEHWKDLILNMSKDQIKAAFASINHDPRSCPQCLKLSRQLMN